MWFDNVQFKLTTIYIFIGRGDALSSNGEEDKSKEDEEPGTQLQINRVTSITFPTYVEPNVKDDMVRYPILL